MFSASVWSVKLSSVSVWSTDSDFSVWMWMMSSVSMWWVDCVFSVCVEYG